MRHNVIDKQEGQKSQQGIDHSDNLMLKRRVLPPTNTLTTRNRQTCYYMLVNIVAHDAQDL